MRFFNSLTRQLEEFPKQKTVSIYSCGPTVYDFAHIGNLRTFLFEDLMIRSFKFFGYEVKHVRNLTDVDDKTIQGAIKKDMLLNEYTETYARAFFDDLQSLNFDQSSTTYLKATEYIPKMIEMIGNIVKTGHGYDSKDGVYFNTSSFEGYGNFEGLDLENIKAGASGSDAFADKSDVGDFVLWKKYKETDGAVKWESPWGEGRPGWHTECAAMVADSFPDGLDIHTGGIDLLFPHHTNEKAHCECLSNRQMSKFWLHATHLLVDGRKMSKSLGNFYTLRSLLDEGYEPRTLRFYLMTGANYRMPMNFTKDGLKAAESALKRLDNFTASFVPTENASNPKLKEAFATAIADDLNVAAAMGELFKVVQAYFNGEKFSPELLNDLKQINEVLGFLSFPSNDLKPEEQTLLEERITARANKQWGESDRLRDELLSIGIEVRDGKDGQTWRRL
ncbi:MAG: cysteine--tRNA ligase [Brevinema sp.]